MLTFSEALLAFAATLTPLYLALLVLSERIERQGYGKSAYSAKIGIATLGLLSLTLYLLNIPSFRTSLTYFILLPVTAGLLLYAFRSSLFSNRTLRFLLFSAIIYHVSLIYSPPFGTLIGERTYAATKLTLEGYWDPGWGLHPTYNPFPMSVGLSSIFSMITFIPITASMCSWIINLSFLVAYDIVLYSLTKRITSSQVAGLLAILIFASTPPTSNVMHHPSMWIGNMLMLLSALAVIKALGGDNPVPNIVMANVGYTAAIFMHASAALGVFLLLGITTSKYFMEIFGKKGKWRGTRENRVLHAVLLTFIVITLTRWIYTTGFLESILPTMKSFVMQMFGHESPEAAWIPLYDRTVHPIQAYAWSTPVAIAFAFMLYSLVRKKAYEEGLVTALCGAGIAFLVVGFLTAVATSISSSNVWRSMYPAFVLLIPAAAVAGGRILRPTPKSYGAILVVLMMTSVGIAVNDSMLSPQGYFKLKGERMAGTGDYLETLTLSSILPSGTGDHLLATYEIKTSFEYLRVAEGIVTIPSYGGKEASESLKEAVYEGIVTARIIYVLQPDVKPSISDTTVNILYDSGRHIAFRKR